MTGIKRRSPINCTVKSNTITAEENPQSDRISRRSPQHHSGPLTSFAGTIDGATNGQMFVPIKYLSVACGNRK